MECEGGITRSSNDELHSWDVHGDETESETRVSQSVIDELHSSDIQRD